MPLKEFELTIPKEYIEYIKNEIKKPKRPNTDFLELWLERELGIEKEGDYGNLPTDESHLTVFVLPNDKFKVVITDTCFSMIKSQVQPEAHSHKISNEDIFHVWFDFKTNKLHSQKHIKVKEVSDKIV